MKLYITTNTKLDLSELGKFYIEPTVSETKETIVPKWNPYEKKMFGDFDQVRRLAPKTGYDSRCFVTTVPELKAVGITTNLAAYDIFDNDGILDFYAGIPAKLDKRAKANGFKTNEAWLFVHEDCHGLAQKLGRQDYTHTMEEQGRLQEYYFELYNELLKTKITMLQQLVSLAKEIFSLKKKPDVLLHPVEKYKEMITQVYGKPNPIYKQTGHHIGTDYACPLGTPVKAPWDGEVIESGRTRSVGNYCHYQYTFNGQVFIDRYLHLLNIPKKGNYKRGDEVAKTGNSGLSTGPHIHIDIFYNKVDVGRLTKANRQLYTVDPYYQYVNKL